MVVRKKEGDGKRIVDGRVVDRARDLMLGNASLIVQDLDPSG